MKLLLQFFFLSFFVFFLYYFLCVWLEKDKPLDQTGCVAFYINDDSELSVGKFVTRNLRCKWVGWRLLRQIDSDLSVYDMISNEIF